MGGQQAGALVLGYRIERHDARDASGRLRAERYDVRCPHTDAVVGHAQSLRMARRLVVMHELQHFSRREKRSPPQRQGIAA